MAFSQSEKIKGGIIWVSSALQTLDGLNGAEKHGAEGVIRTLLNLIAHDLQLAERIAPSAEWKEAQGFMDQAVVMVESGVASEAIHHLTRALSQVTNVGQRTMAYLKKEGLLA